MPKDITVSEFDQLLKDLVTSPQNPAALDAFLSSPAPVQAPLPAPIPVESVEAKAVSPEQGKNYRAPVPKVAVEFADCPFETTIATEKGYANLHFSKFSKAFLNGAKLEQVVRFFQQHGDDFLARCRAQGLR